MINIIVIVETIIIFMLVAIIHGLASGYREQERYNSKFYSQIRTYYDIKLEEYKKDNEVLEDIINGYQVMRKE